jgi:predicted dehydrogenase
MKLRVGLVGLGPAWETRYRPALRTLGDRYEVRAVCEPVAHLAAQAAREFNAAAVDGFRALTSREDVDAILMLSGQWYGVLPVFAACDAGKAVYCATGLGIDHDVARRICQRVEQSGIAFMAELPRRHAPATLRLKELIATRLGAPRLLFCHTRLPAEDPASGRKSCESGDPTLPNVVELVDWCRYVVGREPTSVIGIGHYKQPDSDEADYQMMSLDFSEEGVGRGATAQISCGRSIPAAWHEAVAFRPPAALQVACEHGIAFIDLPSSLTWFDKAGRNMESLESERPVGETMLAQFHRSVTSLIRSTSSLQDVYRAQTVVFQARASYREGCRMLLEETKGDAPE